MVFYNYTIRLKVLTNLTREQLANPSSQVPISFKEKQQAIWPPKIYFQRLEIRNGSLGISLDLDRVIVSIHSLPKACL